MADEGSSAWVERGDAARSAGDLRAAAEAYERALSIDPRAAAALAGLGVVRALEGRTEDAVRLLEHSLAIEPGSAKTLSNLGSALAARGEHERAVEAYERALSIDPTSYRARTNLGNARRALGEHERAVEAYERALAVAPTHYAALVNLSAALLDLGRAEQAIAPLEQAVALHPDRLEARVNLGEAQRLAGRADASLTTLENAAARFPDSPEALTALGSTLERLGRGREALDRYRRALALDPRARAARTGLAALLLEAGRLSEARAHLEEALALAPNFAEAHNNLGSLWLAAGDAPRAAACFEQAARAEPSLVGAESNLLLAMHYDDRRSADEIAAAHRAFGARRAAPAGGPPAPRPRRARRLRVGLVSPDFRRHSVAYFLEPLFERFDRARFELFAYANVARPDEVTSRFASMATAFRNISSLTDDRASELIRADGVDVLVDLAGHTAGGRILLFARRLAPVQVTYLGYPNTTGLPSVDFRLTDAVADPPKMTDAFHSERLFRLAPSAWCYRPPPDAPPPAARRGAVTFGSFNNLAKVSNTSVELWARVLAASPGSRLLLKAKGLDDDLARRRLAERFASAGVDERRLALAPWSPSRQAHLSAYAEVDVALDTFPYHGTTTTCEALWMGVPVVVLEGRTHVSRVGSSLLSNAGVPGWVAKSPEAYVSLAVELARDRAADVEHRAALRARMARSRLLDEAGFARAFESALEGMYDEALERAGAQ